MYDVIVVGAGTAGIPCALEASRNGARVLLLEKDHQVGGTLHISGGHMAAAGTRRQREKGIEDSPALHKADIDRISNHGAREDLADLAVELAAPTLEWLVDNGFEFAPERPRLVYGHEPYGVARTYYGPEQGKSILSVLVKLLDDAVAKGEIELRLSADVVELVVGDSDEVCCLRLRDGSELAANSIVLATGGFGANGELFQELEKGHLVSAAWPTSNGDGITMSRRIGAAIVGEGTYLPTFGGLPSPDGSGRVRWSDRPLLIATERPPHEIYVDRNGKRWVSEDEPSIDVKEHALVGIPDMTFWTIFDARALVASQPMVVGWSPEHFRQEVNNLAGVFAGQSLSELAERAGIDPEGLEQTVAEYNDQVTSGEPDPFGRTFRPGTISEPPFYSLQNHAITLITFSGVDVDSQLRVRKSDGTAFKNLYAVGELLGAGATMGKSFVGGMLVMPSIAFGKWLGEELGKRST